MEDRGGHAHAFTASYRHHHRRASIATTDNAVAELKMRTQAVTFAY